MQITSTDVLFSMEVINLCGGTRLGCVSELEIDLCGGQPTVTALVIPVGSGITGLFSFSGREVYRIPWCRVECIGKDAVLVRLTSGELSECRQRARDRRKE